MDVLRIEKTHLGPAVGVYVKTFVTANRNIDGWLGGGAGINVWKNVDVGGYGGYGTEGWTGGVSVGVGIE